MAWTKRHFLIGISVLYLIVLTAIAAYALHTVRSHSLPIPHALSAFTMALPLISGLSLQILTVRSTRLNVRKSESTSTHQPISYNMTVLILFIYETVVATLAGTYIAPMGSLRCGLEERWQNLWHNKNAKVIRRIQDAFECCGFNSPVDRAYPFPGGGRGVDSCRLAFGRMDSCFRAWRKEERGVAGAILGVVLGVVIWQVLIILVPTGSGSWVAARESDEEHQTNGQRTLEYSPREGGYVDNPEEDEGQRVEETANQPLLRDDQREWASERP